MPQFSKISKQRLESCHKDLQRLFNQVVKHFDCSILEGYRTAKKQNQLYDEGKSKLLYPASKHNQVPSRAVDVIPYPFKVEDWEDIERFRYFASYVRGVADTLGIKIRWGGDWNRNWDFEDNVWNDMPHYELVD